MSDPNSKQPTVKDLRAAGHAKAVPGAKKGHMDDINIPLVAVTVLFFVVTVAVLIGGVEVWYRNSSNREKQAKILPQEDPRTELGQLLAVQRGDLSGHPATMRFAPATGTAASNAASQPRRMFIDIDEAMRQVVNDYPSKGGGM